MGQPPPISSPGRPLATRDSSFTSSHPSARATVYLLPSGKVVQYRQNGRHKHHQHCHVQSFLCLVSPRHGIDRQLHRVGRQQRDDQLRPLLLCLRHALPVLPPPPPSSGLASPPSSPRLSSLA